MELLVLQQNTNAYLTTIDQYELKIKAEVCEFLRDSKKNCLLIESAETRLMSLTLLRVLKAIFDDPAKDESLNCFLGPENQLYSEWQQLVKATNSSPHLQSLKNLLICEVTEAKHLEGQEAFFQKVRDIFKMTVRKKMLFISPKNALIRTYVKSFAELTTKIQTRKWMMPSDKKPIFDKTALYNAALNGFINKVKLNLENGVKIDDLGGPDGGTALHAAARNGHWNIVVHLVKRNANINIQNQDGDTPLHLATYAGLLKVVNALLEKADLQIKNETERTVLHVAADRGHKDLILLYLRHVAVNQPDAFGNTPLHLSVQNGHYEATSALLLNGANPNAVQNNGLTPLYCAVQRNNQKLVETLIENGAELTSKNNSAYNVLRCAIECANSEMVTYFLKYDMHQGDQGTILLHLAAQRGLLDIVKILVNNGVFIHKTLDDDDYNCLHYAAESGNKVLVSWLLVRGVDKFALDLSGRSAMHVAAGKGLLDICQLLDEVGLSVRSQDKYGKNPLCYAASSKNTKLISWLAQHPENIHSTDFNEQARVASFEGNLNFLKKCIYINDSINAKDPMGFGLLHYAVLGDKLNVISWLSNQKNIYLDAKTVKGETAMSMAFRDHPEIVKLLMERGASVHFGVSDKQPLHCATERGYTDIMLLLLKTRVDINAVDEWQGDSALHVAVRSNDIEAVKLLLRHKIDIDIKNNEGETALSMAKSDIKYAEIQSEIEKYSKTKRLPRKLNEDDPGPGPSKRCKFTGI